MPVSGKKRREQIEAGYANMLEKWNTEYEETDILNEYGVTHIVLAGNRENPPLILFHSSPGNSAVTWLFNMRGLSLDFYCAAVDLPGDAGKSRHRDKNRNGFDMQKWMDAVLMELNIGPCYMAGIGSGAAAVLAYMLYNPNVMRAVCIGGGICFQAKETNRPMLSLLPVKNRKDRLLSRIFRPGSGFLEDDPDVALYIKELLCAYGRRPLPFREQPAYDSVEARQIRDKLYFLLGENMKELHARLFRQLQLDQHHMKIFENTGYWPQMERPAAVNKEIREFLINGVNAY